MKFKYKPVLVFLVKMGSTRIHFLATAITFVLLTILILSGAAEAFILSLKLSDSFPDPGELVSLTINAEIEKSEILQINSFTLDFDGPTDLQCYFLPNGTIISDCDGINIVLIKNTSQQYGYTFGEGTLSYNITFNSSILDEGEYNVRLLANLPNTQFESAAKRLIIVPSGASKVQRCSLRGKDGEAYLNDEFLSSNNKLSLGVQDERAKKGEGYITLHSYKNKLYYTFNINRSYKINSHLYIIYISGNVQKNRDGSFHEDAIVIFDANTLKADVLGNSIKVYDMNINLAKCYQ
jgi:hypothetical protein